MPKTRPLYPPEFRCEAIRLVRASDEEYPVYSTGERNGGSQCISRGAVGEGLAGSGVEFERDRIEVVDRT